MQTVGRTGFAPGGALRRSPERLSQRLWQLRRRSSRPSALVESVRGGSRKSSIEEGRRSKSSLPSTNE